MFFRSFVTWFECFSRLVLHLDISVSSRIRDDSYDELTFYSNNNQCVIIWLCDFSILNAAIVVFGVFGYIHSNSLTHQLSDVKRYLG
jgi:hypothetical protein